MKGKTRNPRKESRFKESTPGYISRSIRKSRSASLGFILVTIMIIMAIFAPIISPHNPNRVNLPSQRLPPGSPSHLLGTDHLGRDILSRIIWGSRISLLVGVVAVGIGILMGTFLGLMAGYFRGRIDMMIMRIIDVMICFPTLLLALGIIAILGPAMSNVMLAVGLTMTPRFARLVRSKVLSLREFEYVEAARATGMSSFRVIFKHILPNATSDLIVFATLNIGVAILVESSLSFLGLGVQPPTPTWGNIVAEGRRFLLPAPWISLFPGMIIMLTVLGLNFVGDGIRDALDPRLRGEGK